MTYVRHGPGSKARFGFIVAKSVGAAVVRNRVRRRLKAICFSLYPQVGPGAEIVIRALPGAATASFEALSVEVARSLGKAAVIP